ncbi:MAG: type I-F CRISPR-associated protein Csy1 [Pseudomonadota bacterium]|nr:type I-F CRISPR-associated protein Csy1 [Pseudomonadota bacterium]
MTLLHPDRRAAFRTAIERFLQERRDGKLEKLQPDDPKRDELTAQFAFTNWIDDAARRVNQIQAVTHSIKPMHPDARGTNLYRPPETLPDHGEVGSHTLGRAFADDVVGNAAALDVFKFLRVDIDGRPLLDAIVARDRDLVDALSDDADQASAWIEAFAGLVQPRGALASHARAKQLYWLSGDDPCKDGHYHLLAPLYASSLAHAVFKTINEDRFGDAGKAARQAKREKRDHPDGYHEYPHLAVQKLGGTKPQNISQLNSERGGNNYLLASLPPSWKSRAIREPWLVESVFPRFGRQPDVRDLVHGLRDFLASDPDPTVDTRQRREAYLDALTDELVLYAAELQSALPAGWSLDSKCRLVEAEQLWLDPGRTEQDEAFRSRWARMDWPVDIGRRFGNWLNGQLDGRLPVGEIEQAQWARELLAHTEWAWRIDRDNRTLENHRRRLGGGQ